MAAFALLRSVNCKVALGGPGRGRRQKLSETPDLFRYGFDVFNACGLYSRSS